MIFATVDLSTFVMIISGLVVIRSTIPSIFAYVQRHWTTAGALASKQEWLAGLPNSFELMNGFRERDQAVSNDWKKRMERIGKAHQRCYLLLVALGFRQRTSRFLYWKSAQFRKDFADASEAVRALKTGVMRAQGEVYDWIRDTRT